MTRETYFARKCAATCPRCGGPSSETSVLCERHRADACERSKRWYAKRGEQSTHNSPPRAAEGA